MSNYDTLKQLYKQADSLNEELPGDVIKKMKLYGQIFELVGKFHASSLADWKLAEAKRREALASAYQYGEGTQKEKEARAEIAAAPHRQDEAQKEADCMRWRNAKDSTQETINILKVQLKDHHEVNKGGA
ncbi:hypothetical protein HXA31_20535 [Salipaludibacillus agaradhaerens]|jgi:hypothetical protein|uniref:Uncharacterized protein n=1 Tax=Salipaludibacillus agaradhaerens TaxID=76935 RepID=A0A9Q4B208_SALAG|nr:hypothetical protein [Salipaludibacillus agaradhaerens]MCR6096876.1 hypothetical protein [Salipaludibacillus agaradhaerens]MCR6116720.1 hypothetical protein [Salipaludibacillus agaradhaerens]